MKFKIILPHGPSDHWTMLKSLIKKIRFESHFTKIAATLPINTLHRLPQLMEWDEPGMKVKTDQSIEPVQCKHP